MKSRPLYHKKRSAASFDLHVLKSFPLWYPFRMICWFSCSKRIHTACLTTFLWCFLYMPQLRSQQDSILLFVSFEQTYYSEYIVMYEALTAAGYYVDVRSGGSGNACMYMFGDIVSAANESSSSYTQFTTQFQNMFGSSWNASLNAVPASVPIMGAINSVPSMASYKGLVVAGGTGAVDYRVDGTYAAQGSLSASEVEAAALKLNALAVEALTAGKPVMGQCHGAGIPAYWRVPGTSGPGVES